MNKKILLIVRRTSGEIDWILPLLYKLKKDYEILTVFESYNIYADLRRNVQLFKLWSNVTKKFYVRNFYDNFFLRFFLKFVSKFLNSYTKNIENFAYKKIFINKILITKFNVDNIDEIKFLFHDSGGFTGWISLFKKLDKRIIYYPHSTIKYSKIGDHAKNLYGDLMIVGTQDEQEIWNKFFKGRVVNSGHLKYSFQWLNKFNSTKKNNLKKTIIVLPMKDWINNLEKKKLKSILDDIFEILNENSDKIILYIKLSRKNYYSNYFFLKFILAKYNFSYSFQKESLLSLAKISDLFLVFNDSSVAFDALANKVIPIELWNKIPQISSTKKYTFQVSSKLDFKEILLKYFNNQLKKDLKKKYRMFSKDYLLKIDYKKVLNYFNIKI